MMTNSTSHHHHTPTNPTSSNSEEVLDELVPALVQCFGVIFLGYLAGRWKILPESQAKGLGSYVTKFALPSVFFRVS
ncbi:unnamed protein product [Trichobilharzia regenti]|nr:unnamed protein product [Trichobilharzia regenti]